MKRKLVYWYAQCLDDDDSYSAVGTTRRSVEEQVRDNPDQYGPIEKRYIEYSSIFDLFNQVTSEGGGKGRGIKEGK